MKPSLICLLFILFISLNIDAQIAVFNFNTSPYLQVSTFNTNLTVSDISLSVGTIGTNITTGTYFADEPYIEESGGWAEISQDNAKFFQITIIANTGYTFDINNIAFEAYVTAAGPSVIGVAFDNLDYYSMDAADGQLLSISQSVSGQNGLSAVTIKIKGWDNGSRVGGTTGGGAFRMDNLIITGTVNPIPPKDADSQILSGIDVEPTSISSIQNNAANPFQILDINFSDAGTADGVATIINGLTFTQGSSNTILNWQNSIEGVKLYGPDIDANGISGTLSATNVVFSGSPLISIADGTNETYQLKIYLKADLSTIGDNDLLDIELINSNILIDAGGSSFTTGNVSSGAVAVFIEASILQFTAYPASIYTGQNFSVSLIAIDANGNIDTDFNSPVTLSVNAGTGILSSATGLTKNATTGSIYWSDLQYNTQETFSVLATTTGLANNTVTGSNIVATTPYSELSDDFEDGNLEGWGNTADWANSTTEPINGTQSLKHNLSGITGSGYINHNLAALDLNTKSVVWRFNLKNGDWDPSTQNRFWFYLLANEGDLLSTTVDGYAVGVQLAASGTEDFLTLWKVTNGAVDQVLVQSVFDWGTADLLGIEVIRTVSGDWLLSYSENVDFSSLNIAGEAINSDYNFTNYCGLVFRFEGTIFRAGELWLDNISIQLDNAPPEVLSVVAVNSSTLIVQFSEKVNQSSSENINNYDLSGTGQPINAILSGDGRSVILSFASDFVEHQVNSLSISNIEDISANSLNLATNNFVYVSFVVENVFVVNKNEIILEFSHKLNETSVETITNYLVNNGIRNPISANLQSDTLVQLSFSDFTSDLINTISFSNIIDENGVSLESLDTNFIFHQPATFDVVINEIMADPSPAVQLPEYEYVELFNATDFELCLYNWHIRVGDGDKKFPLINLAPKSYILISSASVVNFLKPYGTIVGVLGTSDLTNSGNIISLVDNQSLVLDSINYSIDWYQQAEKENGGWALERIDPENTCGRLGNWHASIAVEGGSPGKLNSIYNDNIDNQQPVLEEINTISSTEIQIQFNEELSQSCLSNLNNFRLDGVVYPQNAYFIENDYSKMTLVFQNEFSKEQHSLRIENVEDFCGNLMIPIDTSFTFYPGNGFDIVFNELMVDISPAPTVLPAAKYIELYNRSAQDIDLSGWYYQIGNNSPHYFNEFILKSNAYLILCTGNQQENFQTYGNTIGLLSESQLTGTGTSIVLYNSEGQQIDYLNYADKWYQDENKNQGGWSLERIDANNLCGSFTNWKASIDFKGGTPGQENSIATENTDEITPKLLNVKVLTSNKLSLTFSKNITESTAFENSNYLLDNGENNPVIIQFSDTSKATIILQFSGQFIDKQGQSLQIKNLADYCGNVLTDTITTFNYFLIHPIAAYTESSKYLKIIFSEEVEIVSAQMHNNYTVNQGIGNPVAAYKQSSKKNEVYLEFPAEFSSGSSYIVNIINVKDLNGNAIEAMDLAFTYFVPSYNDIIINEILFNPKPGGVDFVEIYNKATLPVDLSKMNLARPNSMGELESIKPLSETNFMFAPSHFLAVSTDTVVTKNSYPAAFYDQFLQIPVLPAYNDDEGEVVLLWGDTIIDAFAYSDKKHFALIADNEGVSLERIDPIQPTNDPDNWHSAAESYGFATPANSNSQYRHLADGIENALEIVPETFSPNNDGFEDMVFIRYQFDEPGYVGNVTIYDAKGRLIKRIASNQLMATQGEFSWDGVCEDKTKARIGIYIVYFEVFNLQGIVNKTKKTCVLAGRLD